MSIQHLRVADFGEFFATRHCGRQIYDAAVIELGADDTLVLDFAGVKAATVAFADELVANLFGYYGPRIMLDGMNPYVAEVIEMALSRRTDLP